MRSMLSFVFALALMLMPMKALAAADATDKELVNKAKSAVALLYSQGENGSMTMHCTATVFDKKPVAMSNSKDSVRGPALYAYSFVSAAHCVGSDDVEKEHSGKSDVPFFVTFDEVKATKKFYPADLKWVGYQHRGEDFSVYEVLSTEDWAVIPLGDEKTLQDGAEILNVASPLGLGKQVFHGTISSLYLDRPVKQEDINWQGSIVLQLPGVNGGSSGSAIISEEQQKIVAFLVGTVGGTTIVAIPVSRFIAVKDAVAKSKYRWYVPADADVNPDGSIK